MNFVGNKFDVNNSNRYNLTWIASQLREELKELSLTISDIEGVGISCGGPLNGEKGVILDPAYHQRRRTH